MRVHLALALWGHLGAAWVLPATKLSIRTRPHRRPSAPCLLPRHCTVPRSVVTAVISERPPVQRVPESSKPGRPYEELTVGVVKETWPAERRVAQTPETVKKLTSAGFNVYVESGAGALASFPDEEYEEAGAKIVDRAAAWGADIVVKVRPPDLEEVKMVGQRTLISQIFPAQQPELLSALQSQGSTAIALDCITRTLSRGQAFDVLSSQANIAGYRAVIEAAHAFGRLLGGQMTAAGKVPPAKVLVVGAGVAGLAAIAQANSMGAVVRAFDVRPAAREQVESAGASFLEVEYEEDGTGSGGYAKQMSPEWHAAAARMFTREAKNADIIITTALIPGKPAPLLITEDMVKSMKAGSVTVDLAAENGGNIGTTKKGEVVVTPNGVTSIGYTDLPSRLPQTSSSLFASNVAKFILSAGPQTTKEKGRFYLDHEDGATRSMLVVEEGRLMWPPPPPPAPAQPAVPAPIPVPKDPEAEKAAAAAAAAKLADAPRRDSIDTAVKGGVLAALTVALAALSNGEHSVTEMTTVLFLATVAGAQLVYGVTPALHSPLMSVTNAISGATALGGLVLLGSGHVGSGLVPATPAEWAAAAAVLLSAVNIGGGFAVTRKMLDLFRRPGDADEFNDILLAPAAGLAAAAAAAPFVASQAGPGAPEALAAAAQELPPLAGLVAALCCMGGIGGLSSQKTARRGSVLGMAGIGIGLGATAGGMATAGASAEVFGQAAALVGTGGAAGIAIASQVGPTELPQTVAAFHSLVGLAATFTAAAEFLAHNPTEAGERLVIYLAAAIGAVTATGSVVAFGKLQGFVSSKPLALPGKDAINLGGFVALVAAAAAMAAAPAAGTAGAALAAGAVVSGLLGLHLVASVGGGDTPVMITILNSSSGWALCAEGFMLQNDLLTIVGALIGSSGAILTGIMCEAMNRNVVSVVLGGYGTKPAAASPKGAAAAPAGEHKETNTENVAELLTTAKNVIIVPGYGLAVAKAQYAIADLARILRDKFGVNVRFAIHPVAGRMPGQLNVLLAEAGVPYDIVFELEDINEDFAKADVSLVVGSNDCVNSAAEDDPSSVIYGMPVLKVWDSENCVFVKRSMATGYAGLDNPVFYKQGTDMLLGDARDVADQLLAKINELAKER